MGGTLAHAACFAGFGCVDSTPWSQLRSGCALRALVRREDVGLLLKAHGGSPVAFTSEGGGSGRMCLSAALLVESQPGPFSNRQSQRQ
eukprot:scaffold1041_cov414-Prasinococcus_capsulatus_cf.AAC.8